MGIALIIVSKPSPALSDSSVVVFHLGGIEAKHSPIRGEAESVTQDITDTSCDARTFEVPFVTAPPLRRYTIEGVTGSSGA